MDDIMYRVIKGKDGKSNRASVLTERRAKAESPPHGYGEDHSTAACEEHDVCRVKVL